MIVRSSSRHGAACFPRAGVLALLAAAVFAWGPQAGAAQTTGGLRPVFPEAGWSRVDHPGVLGLDESPLQALHARIAGGEFGLIDRFVVAKDGFLVTDQRYPHDYMALSEGLREPAHQFNYRHPDWHPFYMGRDVHSLQSVTKSVTSALIGIAIGRGEISGVDASLASLLGAYDLSSVDPRFHDITLEHLLEMRSGIEWHESDRPLDETNTTIQLELSDDWVKFTLAQPMDADPGTKWTYNSGGSHMMSAIIRGATGMTVDKYAEAHLFGPLGIRDYAWKMTNAGLPDTEGGLYLDGADLARIGYLYLNDGVWDGTRIIPEGWVAASTARRVEGFDRSGRGYGYQWWRVDRNGVDVWAGLGYGGQFLAVLPQRGVVGVINSWNLFGGNQGAVLGPFLDALIAASGE